MIFPDARIAFRSEFRVEPTEEFLAATRGQRAALWPALNELIRYAVGHECGATDSFYGGPWFAAGGNWSSKDAAGVSVEVATNRGRFGKDAPLEWAVRADSPCQQNDFRRWRTEVYVRRPEEAGAEWLELEYRSMWSIRPGYIGPEPAPPEDAAPELLRELTNDDQWSAFSGPVRLLPAATRVLPGAAHAMCEQIQSPDRTCPIIAIGFHPETGRPILGAEELAHALAGAAAVFELHPGADAEIESLLPPDYRCGSGMVRVYMPVPFDGLGRARDHRFFHARDVTSTGPAEAAGQIIRGCARRCPFRLRAGVRTIDDVRLEATRYETRDREADRSVGDRLTLAERKFEAVLDDERTRTRAALEQVEALRRSLRDVTARPAAAVPSGKSQEADVPAGYPPYDALFAAVSRQGLGTRTLLEAIDTVGELFPDRVVFTGEARRSAETAGFNTLKTAKSKATKMLWHLATTMHDLVFAENSGDLERAFADRTGIEFSRAERRQTNRLKEAQAARSIVFEGRPFDITPHLKEGSDPKTGLRIHFAFDHDKSRIVVGHCGDHLVTSGTRKLR